MLGPTVSRPVCLDVKHPYGAYKIFIIVRHLRVWCCGALSDERKALQFTVLLVLASAVIFGSQSRGIRDNILLSQVQDFPNLEGQVPVLYPPGTGWPSYTPSIVFPFRPAWLIRI
jgi:hypothetical protein